MKIGLVGLGRMGSGMAERWRRAGHEVIAYSRSSTEVESLADLVSRLDEPRRVWTMIPAGDPTERTVAELAGLLGAGDIVVDGGNADYRDSMRRASELGERGIAFLDVGVSGGVWGLDNGYCVMVGGEREHVEALRPVFEALVEPGGFAHVGPSGSGHYTKMIHNGIEYGLMQSYAEGYEILHASDLDIDVPAAFAVWRQGSVVRSWLLDLLAQALADDPELDDLRGYAEDSGEGRWTVREAVRLGVPSPAISAALYARFASRQPDSPAMKVVAALRRAFGGHEVRER